MTGITGEASARTESVSSWITGGTLLVLTLAVAVNLLSWLGGTVLYQPDSGGYLFGGLALARGGSDFFHSIGLNRVPGYHMLVGSMFALFGAVGLKALVVVQHLMMVVTALMVKLTGDQIDRRGTLGMVAGVMAAFSLQLTGYSNMVMSEVPNAMLVTIGLYFAVRHLREGSGRTFLWGIVFFSLATMVRPAGKMLTYLLIMVPLLRLVLPHWRFLTPPAAVSRLTNLRMLVAGAVINAIIVMPWCLYNWRTYDYFGLTGTLGLNLYSNTIEFGGFMDESSPAIAEIRSIWDRYQTMRVEKGLPPADENGWKVHMTVLGALQTVTGQNTAQVDKILMQAAVDAIRLYPERYLRHSAINIVEDIAWYDPAFLYQVGITEDETLPPRFAHSMSLDRIAQVRRNLETMVRGMGHADIWVGFEPPNAFSAFYGDLTGIYQRLVIGVDRMTLVTGLGLVLALVGMVRTRNAGWLAVIGLIGYTVVVAGFVVPASPRHRLAADPALCLLSALVLLTVIRMFIAATLATVSEKGVLWMMGTRLRAIGLLNDATLRRRLKAIAWSGLVAYILAAFLYMGGKTWGLALAIALIAFFL